METELEAAERHVRSCEAAIARQKLLIEELRQDHRPLARAEKVLFHFEQNLIGFRAKLERMRAVEAASTNDPLADPHHRVETLMSHLRRDIENWKDKLMRLQGQEHENIRGRIEGWIVQAEGALARWSKAGEGSSPMELPSSE